LLSVPLNPADEHPLIFRPKNPSSLGGFAVEYNLMDPCFSLPNDDTLLKANQQSLPWLQGRSIQRKAFLNCCFAHDDCRP